MQLRERMDWKFPLVSVPVWFMGKALVESLGDEVPRS